MAHHLSKAIAGTVIIICTFCESFKEMCGHLFYRYAVAETQIEFRNLKFRNSETSIEFKKPLKYWNLGVKCCNCCNCFIVFMILACYLNMIQVKYQTDRCCIMYVYICNLFSFLMCYYYWFVFHVNANGSFTLLKQCKSEWTDEPMKQSQEGK